MAAPTWEAGASGTANATTTSTLTLPATAADDILIVGYTLRDTTAAPTVAGDYSGGSWTEFLVGSTGHRGGLMWSRCTGDHSGQTITISHASAGSIACFVAVIRGCTTSGSPIDTNTSQRYDNASPDVNTLAAFNTTVVDTLVCLTVHAQDNIAWSAQTKNGTGMNERADATSSGGNDSQCGLAELAQAGTGTTGSYNFTQDLGTVDAKWIHAFALKPIALTAVGTSRILPSTVYKEVGHSAILPSKLEQIVGRSVIEPYALHEIVGRSAVLPYEVALGIASVGRSTVLLYALWAGVGHSVIQPYALNEEIGRSVILPYPVWVQVGRSAILPYPVWAAAGRSAILPYEVAAALGPVGRSVILLYTVAGGAAAPQIARPIQDIAQGTWDTRPTPDGDLYAVLDETSEDTGDWIESAASPGTPDICEVKFGSVTDPSSSTGHILRFGYQKDYADGDTLNLTVKLVDGTTVIATRTYNDIETHQLVEVTLTAEEADAITNYDDLRVRFEAVKV